jgi:hypothetical protein
MTVHLHGGHVETPGTRTAEIVACTPLNNKWTTDTQTNNTQFLSHSRNTRHNTSTEKKGREGDKDAKGVRKRGKIGLREVFQHHGKGVEREREQ